MFRNRIFRKLFILAVAGILVAIPGGKVIKDYIIAVTEMAIQYGNMKGMDNE